MAKLRLNSTHRELLRHFAAQSIVCKAEVVARDKAYAKAAKAAREAAEKQYPPADMAILEKYGVTDRKSYLQGGSPTGQSITFYFHTVDEAPLCPDGGHRLVKFSQDAVNAISAYELVSEVLKEARSEKLAHYHALIEASRTYEDVLEVWPAAGTLSDRIRPSTALVALSEDVRRFIRRDNAGSAFQRAA